MQEDINLSSNLREKVMANNCETYFHGCSSSFWRMKSRQD
ncbi:hypothetical protein CSC36_3698 [Pseudomonas aeruginosa]|nr:hypothetical protein CSC36_3698 [Pseudomonas aeruginosa]